jgi:hypothetical protein
MRIFAILLVIWGLLIVSGSILMLSKPEEMENSVGTTIAVILIMGVLPLVSGAWILLANRRYVQETTEGMAHARLIEYAHQHNNKITIAETAMILKLPIERAEANIEDLRLKGFFELEMTDTGTFVYVLNQNIGGLDKADSKSLL